MNRLSPHDGQRVVLEAVESGRLQAAPAHALAEFLADPGVRSTVMEGSPTASARLLLRTLICFRRIWGTVRR
jgi:hypothetical protein